MIESSLLGSSPRLRHAFFTRRGGVSTGIYASLNCGFGSADAPTAVAENRALCAGRLGVEPAKLLTVHQVHGTGVAEIVRPWKIGDAPRADALVTRERGVALGILTADCGPILLADTAACVIGAAHAGWKGAKAGIIEAVIAAMTRLGANVRNIAAAVGPTIGPASYEVGEDFRKAFVTDDPSSERFFAAAPGFQPYFDLQSYIVRRLEAQNLASVDRITADTCGDMAQFFSYRRSCRNGEPDYGRQLSAITLL
jgi:YfiH family protein